MNSLLLFNCLLNSCQFLFDLKTYPVVLTAWIAFPQECEEHFAKTADLSWHQQKAHVMDGMTTGI